MPNYVTMTAKAHSLIKRRGTLARLRRNGVDRIVHAMIADYSPRERGLRLEGARRVLISVNDPATGTYMAQPPDHEEDLLVYAGDIYRLPTPLEGAKPVDKFLYFELQVVFEQQAES